MEATDMRSIVKSKSFACGHSEDTQYIISASDADGWMEMFEDLENYSENRFCAACAELNAKYGMVNVVESGTYDCHARAWVFKASTGIRDIVRFAHAKGISLHYQSFPTYSPYDCTGQLIAVDPKVTKGRKYTVLTVQYHYDY